MIGEAGYIELMKNCQKWNNRIRGELKNHLPFFDQQTAVAHRASKTLKKTKQSRVRSTDANYVVSFGSQRWRKKKSTPSDAAEVKLFMQMNPAIAEALHAQSADKGEFAGENGTDAYPSQDNRRGVASSKYDDFDNDDENFSDGGSDGDDWGKARKRGKKAMALSKKKAGHHKETPKPPPKKPRFGHPCDICRAKYKSKPGLIHHKAYWHNIFPPAGAPNPNKLISPSVDVSDSCDFCLGSRFENKNTGLAEDLVSCQDCGRSAHPTCLKFTSNTQFSIRCFGWQCIECKSCAICGTSVNDDQLLFCDDCDRGFHLYCLRPKLSKAPEGLWSCHLCQRNFGDKASAPANLPLPPT